MDIQLLPPIPQVDPAHILGESVGGSVLHGDEFGVAFGGCSCKGVLLAIALWTSVGEESELLLDLFCVLLHLCRVRPEVLFGVVAVLVEVGERRLNLLLLCFRAPAGSRHAAWRSACRRASFAIRIV